LKEEGRKWKHKKQRDNKKVISFALVAHDENTAKSEQNIDPLRPQYAEDIMNESVCYRHRPIII
jgi:hypothetical protein